MARKSKCKGSFRPDRNARSWDTHGSCPDCGKKLKLKIGGTGFDNWRRGAPVYYYFPYHTER